MKFMMTSCFQTDFKFLKQRHRVAPCRGTLGDCKKQLKLSALAMEVGSCDFWKLHTAEFNVKIPFNRASLVAQW